MNNAIYLLDSFFVMGGPIGALFGYFIGSTFDTATVVTSGPGNDPGPRPTGRGDFLLSLVVLATALMKADGKVTRNELEYVKKFFRFPDVIFVYDNDDFINTFLFFERVKRVCQYGFPGNYDELFG